MEYRILGRSGLKVSKISLGSLTFGDNAQGIGGVTVEVAQRILDRLLDAGVNFVDTAEAYSAGEAETILGEVINGRRERLLIGTKVRFPTGLGPNDGGLSRTQLIEKCEASLRRLGTDYIDLYQMHGWDGQTPLEETLSTLDGLVRQGKIRYIGCSNHSGWHLMKALAVSDRLSLSRYVSHQLYYSLVGREAEYELLPAGIDQDVGALVWGPLAGGLLTGKYGRDRQWPAGSRHTANWHEPPVSDWEAVFDIVDVLLAIAGDRHVTAAQVALSYVMAKPGVTSVIVGVRTEEQLADNLAAADLALSASELDRLDAASAIPLLYPYWHQRRMARDRMSPADETLLGQTHWSGAV